MGSVSTTDDLQNTVKCASQTHLIIQNLMSTTDLASRPYQKGPTVRLSDDKFCNDERAKTELHNEQHRILNIDYDPMRTVSLCHLTAKPRRFYRTFWRALVGRLKKLEGRIKVLKAEILAYKTKISSKKCK
jgi:hypothetical protein